jgi:hypothetical protein
MRDDLVNTEPDGMDDMYYLGRPAGPRDTSYLRAGLNG